MALAKAAAHHPTRGVSKPFVATDGSRLSRCGLNFCWETNGANQPSRNFVCRDWSWARQPRPLPVAATEKDWPERPLGF